MAAPVPRNCVSQADGHVDTKNLIKPLGILTKIKMRLLIAPLSVNYYADAQLARRTHTDHFLRGSIDDIHGRSRTFERLARKLEAMMGITSISHGYRNSFTSSSCASDLS